MLREPPRAVLWLDYRAGMLCAAGNAHGGRAQLTSLMIELALGEASRELRPVPDFALSFDLNDHSCRADLAYARCRSCRERRPAPGKRCSPLLAPDYTLLSWRTAGIDSYALQAENFQAAGTRPATGRRVCGWAGSVESNTARRLFVREAIKDQLSLIEAITPCTPTRRRARSRRGHGASCTAPISQTEQIRRWPCVVDLPGWGYSGRLPLLLRSGRPLLFSLRPMETWYRDESHRGALRAWEHYVPVLESMHNVVRRADTLLGKNYSSALEMAARAQVFARRFLTLRTAVRYLMYQILRAAHAPDLPPHAELLLEAASRTGNDGDDDSISRAANS
jgi:hypothetical protein